MKNIIISVIAALLVSVSVDAQTLHAIIFCNTLDEKIGTSCLVDHNLVRSEISYIADNIGYDIKYYDCSGHDCSKEKLMSILSDLNCINDDIVFFYYTGHGVHAAADPGSFPQMCLKYHSYDEDKFVPVKTVDELIAKKSPRFRLIVTDCCNNIADWVSAKGYITEMNGASIYKEEDAANYKKLFLNQTGSIMVTSSKKGQVSWCTAQAGGAFTLSFWDNLYQVGIGKLTPDWNTVLNSVKKTTLSRTSNKQEPYFTCNVANSNTNPSQNGSGNSTNTDSSLSSILTKLLDSSSSTSVRVQYADDVYKQYFSTDAKVEVVGRNTTTTVAFEDANVFLDRLSLSKKIRKVNVIRESKNSVGKINYLIVHEVYNE